MVKNEDGVRALLDELRDGRKLAMRDTEVEGQTARGQQPNTADELRVCDRLDRLALEQPPHSDNERLRRERAEARLDREPLVDGGVGDDSPHERPGHFLHPAHLVHGLVVAAVRLHENRPSQLMSPAVDVLGAEPPPQGRLLLEPAMATLGRIPEVKVRVEDPAHQRTTRAAPPRITCSHFRQRRHRRVAGVVIASAPCATA